MQVVNNLYILGTASLGMTRVPIRIQSEQDLYSYFGTSGTLVDAYRKISDITNYPNIYLMKINGVHASIDINVKSGKEVIYKGMSITSIYSNDDSDIKLIFTDRFMQILYGKRVIEYDFGSYNTIHSLIQKVNSDAEKLISPVKIINNTLEEYSHPSIAIVSCNKPIVELPKSQSGLNDTKLQNYFDIEQSLRILDGLDIDYIIFADNYIDDDIQADFPSTLYCSQSKLYRDIIDISSFLQDDTEKLSYYDLMLNFCVKQYKNKIITKGIIGLKPMVKELEYQYYESVCDDIKTINDKFNIDSTLLSLVSVTAGDTYYDSGGAIDNHYIAYAGVMASEGYDVNISNIDYGDNISLRYFLDSDKAKLFSSMKFIMPRHSYLTNKCHIVNGTNLSSGILSNEFVIRTMQYSNKVVKVYLDKFLGESISPSLIKKINLTAREMFNDILENTCITNYSFSINNINDEVNIFCEFFFPGYIDPIKIII